MKLWTVEFQVPEIVQVPAETEEEAIELAWERVQEIGYLYAEATEELEEVDYPRLTTWIDTDEIFDSFNLDKVIESQSEKLDEEPDVLSPDGN